MEKISNLIFSKNLINFTKTNLIKRQLMTSTTIRAKEALEKLKKNEYFEKYADKIAKLQQTSPEEFLSRIEEHENEAKRKIEKQLKENQYSQLLHPKKPINNQSGNDDDVREKLDNIMKVDLIKDKNVDEIKKIWTEYHLNKTSYLSAIIPSNDYDELIKNSIFYPTFIFALPRSQGYEFIMSQFDRNSIHFTPLLYYQVHKENAPECLTINHYTELKENKGIVLMRGEYDDKIIDSKEAQCLTNQLQLYYIKPSNEKLKLMEIFTKKPDQFKHMDLVKEIENLTL